MRKSLVLLLALLLVVTISICACKKNEEPAESGTQPSGETTTEEVTTTEETDEPKPALKPLTPADTYNVAEGDWTARY